MILKLPFSAISGIRRSVTGYLAAALVVVLLLPGCMISKKHALRYLEKARAEPYDVIVVPGVPLEEGKWSRIMKARVYWSKYLYDQGIARNIIYSGSAVYTPYIEAEVMARYAEALGIPREHIFLEKKAEHSTENIYYGYQQATQLHFKRIALATDPFQTKMLRRFTRRKVSPDVGLVPIVFDTLRAMEPDMIDPVIDFSGNRQSGFTALPERKSFWARLRGTMGFDLPGGSSQ